MIGLELRGSRPAVEVLYFCFAKRKYPKKRRPAARRIPAPAAPPRARPELAARYRRAAADSRPLKTLSGTSASARADGSRFRWYGLAITDHCLVRHQCRSRFSP